MLLKVCIGLALLIASSGQTTSDAATRTPLLRSKLCEIRDGYNNFAKLEYEEWGGTRGKLKAVVDNRGLSVNFNFSDSGDFSVTNMLGNCAAVNGSGISGAETAAYSFTLNGNGRITHFSNARGANFIVNPSTTTNGNTSSLDDKETTDVKPNTINGVTPGYTLSTNFGKVLKIQRPDAPMPRFLVVNYQFTNHSAVVDDYQITPADPAIPSPDPKRESTITYDPQRGVWLTKVVPTNSTTDAFGNTTTTTVTLTQTPNDSGQIVASTNLLGGTYTFGYDPTTGLPTSSQEPSLGTNTITYQSPGNSRVNEAFISGTPYNHIKTLTLPQVVTTPVDSGRTRTSTYDYSGGGKQFLKSVAEVDSKDGQPSTVMNSAWDAFGLVMASSGPRAGYSTAITYDDFGHYAGELKTINDSMQFDFAVTGLDSGSMSNIVQLQTAMLSDCFGQAKVETLPDKRTLNLFQDQRGNPVSTQGPILRDDETQGVMTMPPVTQTFFDIGNAVTDTRDLDGRTTHRDISNLGMTTNSVDAAGAVTTNSSFDALLMPQTIMLPPVMDGGTTRQATIQRDLVGRTTLATLPGNRTIKYAYDDSAMTVMMTDPLGNSSTKTLNPNYQLNNIQGPLLSGVTMAYYLDGEKQTVSPSGLGATTTDWNIFGSASKVTLPELGDTTYAYETDGTRKMSTFPGSPQIVTQNLSDSFGRVRQTLIGGVQISGVRFDDNSDKPRPGLVTATHGEGPAITVRGTGIGQENQLVPDPFYRPDAWFTAVVTPGYTSAQPQVIPGTVQFMTGGEVTQSSDGLGNVTTNQYNNPGVTYSGTTDPDSIGMVSHISASGFLMSVDDNRPGSAAGTRTTIYHRDADTGFVDHVTLPDGRTVDIISDANGNQRFVTYNPQAGSTYAAIQYEYQYDALNRRTDILGPRATDGMKITLQHVDYYNNSKPEFTTDAEGRVVLTIYDDLGRLTETDRNPGTQQTKYAYDPNGQIGRVDNPDGTFVSYTYDNRGRVDSTTASASGVTVNVYDPVTGDLVQVVDGNGTEITHDYDTLHRPVHTQLPLDGNVPNDTAKDTYQFYDQASRLLGSTDANKNKFRYGYFNNGRRNAIYNCGNLTDAATPPGVSDGNQIGSYTWDGDIPTSDGATSWTLDLGDRPAVVSGSGASCSYQYLHPLGLPTSKSYGSTNLVMQYDSGGFMKLVSDGANSLTYTQRTPLGRPQAAQYGNGIAVAWDYDSNLFLKHLEYSQMGDPLQQYDTTNDNTGRRLSLDLLPSGEHFGYDYDSAARLWHETRTLGSTSKVTTYGYDALSNRASVTVNGATDNYHYDVRNELRTINHGDGGLSQFDYDDNGNRIGKNYTPANGSSALPEQVTFNFDNLNRMFNASRIQGGIQVTNGTFNYPTFGWQMTDQNVNGETRSFGIGYGGEQLTETIPNFGTRTYVNGGLDSVMWSSDTNDTTNPTKYHLPDINGTEYAIAGNTGGILDTQTFSAFGIPGDINGNITPSITGNLLGYQGKRGIPGIGDYSNYRFRDPYTNTFLSPDPLGGWGGNRFGAFGHDGVNRSDPMGTEWVFHRTQWGTDYYWNDESDWGGAAQAPTGDKPTETEEDMAALYFEAHPNANYYHSLRPQLVGGLVALNPFGDINMFNASPFLVVKYGGSLYVPKEYKFIAEGVLDLSRENLAPGEFGAHYMMRYDNEVRGASRFMTPGGMASDAFMMGNFFLGQRAIDLQGNIAILALTDYLKTSEGAKDRYWVGVGVGGLALSYAALKSEALAPVRAYVAHLGENFAKFANRGLIKTATGITRELMEDAFKGYRPFDIGFSMEMRGSRGLKIAGTEGIIEADRLDSIVGPGRSASISDSALHHPWPKYLGGKELQELVDMPTWLHQTYHSGLDAIGLPKNLGAKYYLSLSAEQQALNINNALDFTRKFDTKFGSDLYNSFLKELNR